MNIKNKELKRRIIEISYKHKLSHLGSCLTAVDIIAEIYAIKKPDEKFVLSSGHAGLALYVVLEKYDREHCIACVDAKSGIYRTVHNHEGLDAEKIFEHHGVHPDKCSQCHLDCSTGSLGQGLPMAVGMALADRSRNVYCLISDGECAEGSIWEALRISKENKLENLKLHFNFNGWAAYKETTLEDFLEMSSGWAPNREARIHKTDSNHFPFLNGLSAHYYTMKDQDYTQAMELLK